MKFLVTNDDGIDAPGLAALIGAAGTLGEPVVVAPAGRAIRRQPRRHLAAKAFGSSPAARIVSRFTALPPIAPGSVCFTPCRRRKWILSGINHGANLGADVYYSGTVAAVREGAPARLARDRLLALPQERRSSSIGRARPRWITPLLADLLARPIETGSFLQRQPAAAPAGCARSGSRLVSARSKTASAQLPARGRKRPLFCRRLQPAAPHSGRRR